MRKKIKTAKGILDPGKAIYTIEEFCKLMCIGRTLFYKLRLAKQGPKMMKLGRSVRIHREAIEEWQKKITK